MTDHSPQFLERHLNWEACYNTRDLGGLATQAGQQTRWQSVIRSDHLGRLTPAGDAALINYGVRTIIDLRSPQEAQEEPYPFSSATTDSNKPCYLNLPLENYEPHVSELIRQATTRAEVYCLNLDHYPEAVARVMEAIAHAQPGGVLVHCHAGKDRTGIVAALLLSLAGVPLEMIAADYAESQARLWPLYEKTVAESGGEDKVEAWLKPIALPETMYHMLAHMDQKYGGAQKYLEGAGLSALMIERLKRRLLPAAED